MIQIIPTKPIPNQNINIVVNGQQLTIKIYVNNNDHLYCDVYLQESTLILGAPVNHMVYINQYTSAFIGYLFFWNTTGLNPIFQELGKTCQLYYSDEKVGIVA